VSDLTRQIVITITATVLATLAVRALTDRNFELVLPAIT